MVLRGPDLHLAAGLAALGAARPASSKPSLKTTEPGKGSNYRPKPKPRAIPYAAVTVPVMSTPPPGFPTWEAAIDATSDARREAIGSLGNLAPEVRMRGLAPSVLRTEPKWPATPMPSLLLVERFAHSLLFTNGLSDPFRPELHDAHVPMPEVGHACELFIELVDALPEAADGQVTVARHWSEHVLWAAADWEASSRVAHDLTAKFGAITTMIVPCAEIARYVLPSGLVAVLIGQQVPSIEPTIELPLVNAALLAVQLLLPAEYAFAINHGNDGGNMIAERLAAEGVNHLVLPARRSVV